MLIRTLLLAAVLCSCGGQETPPDAATRFAAIRGPILHGDNGWDAFESAYDAYREILNRVPRPTGNEPIGAYRADVTPINSAATLSDQRTTNAQGFIHDLEAAGVFDHLEILRRAPHAVLEAPAEGDLTDFAIAIEDAPSKARQLSRLIVARMRMLAESGRPEDAAAAFAQGVAIARSLRSNCYPLCQLAAPAVESMLWTEAHFGIREGRYNEPALVRMTEALGALDAPEIEAASHDAWFLFSEVNYAREWPNAPYSLSSVRRELEKVRDGPAPAPEFEMDMARYRESTEKAMTGEGLAPVEFAQFERHMLAVRHGLELRHQVERDLLRTTIAIERHRLSTGRLPATLSDLSPKYLTAVPQNPVTGKPFAYRAGPTTTRAGDFVLYDLGLDGADNGGPPDDSAMGAVDWNHGGDLGLDRARRGLD